MTFGEMIRNVNPEVSLHEYHDAIKPWWCDCGCLFIPGADENETYLDRFEMAGGCDTNYCPCHDLPKTLAGDD